MTIQVKICGLKEPLGLAAAVENGAAYVGFVFYPKSPRFVTPETAGDLARLVPAAVKKVGLVVDATDEAVAAILAQAPLDMLQVHGRESPERVADLRRRFGLPVMKAIAVANAADIAAARAYETIADLLLFDAKPPPSLANALPGGNAVSFDWSLLAGQRFARPFMLSGGLHSGNLAAAVAASGARILDVSSGVESAPGAKDPNKIKAFLALAQSL